MFTWYFQALFPVCNSRPGIEPRYRHRCRSERRTADCGFEDCGPAESTNTAVDVNAASLDIRMNM